MSSDRHVVTVAFKGHPDQRPEGCDKAAEVKWGRVPGLLQQRISTRALWMTRSSSQAPALRTQMAVLRTISVKKSKSWVLRCSISWHYSPRAWHDMKASPATGFRQWAAHCGAGSQPGIMLDTWGWQETAGGNLQGLARIGDLNACRLLLNMSGRSHGDVTWFTDIAGQVETEPRLRVVWQDWRDGERWAGYLKRAQDCTSLGLVLGRRQLGLRVKDDDPRWQQRPCSWKVDGLPQEKVVDILKDLGFQAIDVHGHNPRGRTKVWCAKATRSDDLDVVQTELQMDGLRPVQLTVTKEAKTFKGLPAWPLKPERRGSYLRDEGPTAHVPDADLPLETQESMDLDREAPGVPAAEGETAADAKSDPAAEAKQAGKRAPEPQVRGKAKRQASAPWEHGGQVVPNDGGGDCLWKAIAQGLTKQEPSKPRTHRQLRAFVGSYIYMQTNCSIWDALWRGQGSLNSKGQEKLPSFQAYLDEQLLQGSWSGALEILAFCTARKCRVWVVTKDGKLWLFNAEGQGQLLVLLCGSTATSSCSTCRRTSSGDATLSSLFQFAAYRLRVNFGFLGTGQEQKGCCNG